jgi:uncharacterized membrane protein YwaF
MATYPGNLPWFAFLALCAGIGVAVHFALRHRTIVQRQRGLAVLAIASWALFTWFILDRVNDPDIYFPLSQNLPFQFCSVITCLLIPATLLNWKWLRVLCYFPGVLGAFLALVSPAPSYCGFPLLSLSTIGFFGGHAFNVIIPILMTTLGLYTPSYRDAWRALLYLVALCAAIMPLDLILRATIDPKVNYFYFFDPEGAGILELLYKLIGIPVVYELPVLPLAYLIFLGQAGAYFLLKRLRNRSKAPGDSETVAAGAASAAGKV